MKSEIKAVVSGLATWVPRYTGIRETGGANSARYCYSVWLRHLSLCEPFLVKCPPRAVMELGPGRSLGVGLAALLSGVKRYLAVDAVSFAGNVSEQLEMLEELRSLFIARADIPTEQEFPNIKPALSNHHFPRRLINDIDLDESLQETCLAAIRHSLNSLHKESRHGGSVEDRSRPLSYLAPWGDAGVEQNASFDLIISQAVMEHVSDVDMIYRSCMRLLKPGGLMSHQIDFKSHGKASEWNGHWKYPMWLWRVIVGRRPFLINRVPLSGHLKSIERAGFEILAVVRVSTPSQLERSRLAEPFQDLSDDDLTTSGAAIIARKNGLAGPCESPNTAGLAAEH